MDPYDPFREARQSRGAVDAEVDGTAFTMFLRHDDLRRICRDPGTFTSATPFRVPIPPEHDIRPTAQLPIESDPPLHTAYRRLMDPYFSRPAVNRHGDAIRLTAESLVDAGQARGGLEVVGDFALPLFLRSLALVLRRPQEDVARWLTWGTQALATDTEPGVRGNTDLNAYIDVAVDSALAAPGDDFFGHLVRSRVDGRSLTRDEIRGFANLTFAGGRQTVVYALTNALHHLATSPGDLHRLAADRQRIPVAIEEYLRFMTPITHLGRTATRDVEIGGTIVAAGRLVSVCFASANRDRSTFDRADELRLDRKPNRHVAFGHGPHTCVGAPMARLVLLIALECIVDRCPSLQLAGEPLPHHDDVGLARVQVGYDRLELLLGSRM